MKVCLIGLGYVGLPQAVLLARSHDVVGVDIDARKVEAVNAGRPPFEEVGLEEALARALESGFRAAAEPEEADAFVLCVPTPLRGRSIDTRPLVLAAEAVAGRLRGGELVVVESTVGPGTCLGVVEPILASSGKPFLLAYCPERAIPGRTLEEMATTPRVVGVESNGAISMARALYEPMVPGLKFTGLKTAEVVKVAENTFRAVNLALANELADLCERIGVDVAEVIDIANRHPRVEYLRPGSGVGGHCIPLDPWMLVDGLDAPIIRMAMTRNEHRPMELAMRVAAACRKGDKVAVLGLAYKPDTDDRRESPSNVIVEWLKGAGMTVATHDPYAPGGVSLGQALDGAQAAVVTVRHRRYAALSPATFAGVRMIFDFCRAFPEWWAVEGSTLVRLGDGR